MDATNEFQTDFKLQEALYYITHVKFSWPTKSKRKEAERRKQREEKGREKRGTKKKKE